jgi:alpha-glucuronidase
MKRCIASLFTLFYLLFPLCCALAQQPLTIAVRGEAPRYVIVRPAVAASPSQVYAAEELQKFIAQATGVELPIQTDEQPFPETAIILGNTKYSEALLGEPADMDALGDDGFRLVTRKNHLMILGGPVRGTLYGVYEVLERFAKCRWYS